MNSESEAKRNFDLGVSQTPSPEEIDRYLYGECDRWAIEHFIEGMEIIAYIRNSKEGLVHCYLRHEGNAYDVRGKMPEDTVLSYTETTADECQKFLFDAVEDFKQFLVWLDFEMIKDAFIANR